MSAVGPTAEEMPLKTKLPSDTTLAAPLNESSATEPYVNENVVTVEPFQYK
jgi:hypothetical protein